jgi:hypothetical protein
MHLLRPFSVYVDVAAEFLAGEQIFMFTRLVWYSELLFSEA